MAQNSDALQEPSMDELLASIREIIEENTGIPPQESSPARGANGAQNRMPPMNGAGRYDAALPNLKQDIFVRNDNKPASGPNGRPLYGSPHPNNTGGAGPNAPVYPNSRDNIMAPAGQNNGQMPGGRAAGGGYPGAGGYGQNPGARPMREAPQGQPRAPQPEAPQNMRRPDARAAQDARPVQDSMNALAERIGLRRSPAPAPAYNAPAANNSAPQGSRPARAERPAPAAPASYNAPINAMPPQNGNFSPAGGAAASQAGRSSGAAPYPQPQNGDYGYNESSRNENGRPQRAEENGGQSAPRFNPAAMAGYQQREREAAERQPQPYEAESRSSRPAYAAADIMPAARPQNAERPGMADWLDSADASGNEPAKLSPAAAYAASELKKAFPAEVEHSAENLLRPFITQWLDEHFRELFEKVLREEVQRFIQSMHRNE